MRLLPAIVDLDPHGAREPNPASQLAGVPAFAFALVAPVADLVPHAGYPAPRPSAVAGEPPGARPRRAAMRRFVLAAAMLVAAGCTSASPGAPSPTPPVLDGRTFLSTGVTVDGVARPLVESTRIRIAFSSGNISAAAGCNQMGGAFRLEGSRLVVDSMHTTDMACDPPRMEQDSWLAALLTGRPIVTLAGSDLAIERDGTVVRLLDRRIADPDLSLVGPTWQVDTLISAGSASSAPWEHPATLVFGTDGRVSIDTGCNTGNGRYAAGQGSLRVSEIGLTKRGCSGDAGRLEQAVLEVLRADQLTFSIEAKSLTLSAGEHGLGLRAE